MKLMVDFENRKTGAPANESWDIPNELMPLISAYAWKPKKGDAVMDFIAELSECETECDLRAMMPTASAWPPWARGMASC